MLSLQGETSIHVVPRAIANISSCRVYANSRRGIVKLGSTFGSIFLLFFFFMKVAGAHVHSNQGKSLAPVALSEWVSK